MPAIISIFACLFVVFLFFIIGCYGAIKAPKRVKRQKVNWMGIHPEDDGPMYFTAHEVGYRSPGVEDVEKLLNESRP